MKIFISYRHSEGIAGEANVIHDRLVKQFGAACVFLDSGVLAVGDPFPAVLQAGLATCKVFLVLIDPQWLASADRLHNSADWVRREIETALRRRADDGIRVIPVLLQGAAMPEPERLPASLAGLADLHAAPLHGATLKEDLELLVLRLEGWLTLLELRLWLLARRQASLWVMLGLVLLFCASVVAMFDSMNLETGLEALTLAGAEAIANPKLNEQLVIVVIDKTTKDTLKKRAFDKSWRKEHAQLIRNLSDAGAAVVAFDIYLAEPSEFDTDLFEAIKAVRSTTRVVFGMPPINKPGLMPPPDSVDLGLLCLGSELNLARLAPLVVGTPQVPAAAASAGEKWQYLTSFGAMAALPSSKVGKLDLENRQVFWQFPAGESSLQPFSRIELNKERNREQICAAQAEGNVVAQKIVRFTSLERLREPKRRYRYEDLCCDTANSAESAEPVRSVKLDTARYSKKIVLVGSELDPNDIQRVFSGRGFENRFGYEVHADLINTLLNKNDIRAVSPWLQFLVMQVMGLLGMLARFWRALWKPVRGRLFVFAVPLLYLVLCVGWCVVFDQLLNGVYHLAAFVVAYVVSGMLLRRNGLLTPRGV